MTNSILHTLHNGSIIDYLTSSVNVNLLGVNSKSFSYVSHDKMSSLNNATTTTATTISTATSVNNNNNGNNNKY